MKVKDVVITARASGLRCNEATVKRRWMQGYYLDKNQEKVWYFPDHTRLAYADNRLGGYTFSPEAVHTWIKMMVNRKKNL